LSRRPTTTTTVIQSSSLPSGPITGVSGAIGTTITTNAPIPLTNLILPSGTALTPGTKLIIHSASSGNSQIIIPHSQAQQITAHLQQQQQQQIQK